MSFLTWTLKRNMKHIIEKADKFGTQDILYVRMVLTFAVTLTIYLFDILKVYSYQDLQFYMKIVIKKKK